MKQVLERVDSWWFERAPAARLAVVRAAIGGFCLVYLVVRAANLNGYATFPAAQFAPLGVVRLLSQPLAPWLVHVLYGLTLLFVFPVIVGFRFRWTAPIFAALWCWLMSYRSSWGMIFHTENLVTLHVLVLAVSAAADTWSIDAKGSTPGRDDGRYGWPLKLMCVVTVLAYVLAGVAKLRNAGWEWVTGDQLRIHIAYDNLRKIQLGDIYSPLGAWLVRYQWLFPPMAWFSLALELGAPLALVRRRWAAMWAWGMWAFHAGILCLMAILFAYPLSGVAFLPFSRAEKILEWPAVARLRTRRDRMQQTAAAP
jgi:hypothetical protein